VLCPQWQTIASSTDGAFDPSDLWTLTSATIDFSAAGVQPQMVVQLQKPSSTYKGTGQFLTVDTVAGNSLGLRRLGAASQQGSPPGPVGGLTGIQFLIATLNPQIEEESFIINREWNIDPTLPGRQPGDVGDLRDLRYACVLGVLFKRYMAETREDRGDFNLKAKSFYQELSEVKARLTVRWAAAPAGSEYTNRFNTRLAR